MARPDPRRRSPRLFLAEDGFVVSQGCSTLGRGLVISPKGALLPVNCVGPLSAEVTLHVCLPSRPKMFNARGTALAKRESGWAIAFEHVTLDDLHLLLTTLFDEHGLAALSPEDRKYSKLLPPQDRVPRDSISRV